MSVESCMNKHEAAASSSPSAGRCPILQTPDLLLLGAATARDSRIRVMKISCMQIFFGYIVITCYLKLKKWKIFFLSVVVWFGIAMVLLTGKFVASSKLLFKRIQ